MLWRAEGASVKKHGSPEYWAERAAQARALGDEIRDDTVKEAMERVAKMYDRLAERVAKQAAARRR